MIRMTVQNVRAARDSLMAHALTPARKRRVLKRMGGHVAKASKARITRQETVDGGKFAPRKARRDSAGSARRKLLVGFRKNVRVRLHGDAAVIYVAAPGHRLLGRWAKQQQEGFTQIVQAKVKEAQGSRRRHGASPEGPGAMATRRQARRLKELGWKQSQKWMMQHYSRKQAGVMIRHAEGRRAKTSWRIVVPARPFLGANAADRAKLRDLLADELKRVAA